MKLSFLRFSLQEEQAALLEKKTLLTFPTCLCYLWLAISISLTMWSRVLMWWRDREGNLSLLFPCLLVLFTIKVTVHLSIPVQLIECQLPPKTNFSALAPAFNPSVNFLLHRLFFPGQKDSSVRPKERIDILGPGGEMGITPLYNGWALNVKGNEDWEAWPAFSHVTSICHTGQAEFQGLKDKLSAGLLQWKFFLHWDHWTVLHFVKSLSTPSFNIMSFS